jgi:hypothetical protein
MLRITSILAIALAGCAELAEQDDPRLVESDDTPSCGSLLANGSFDGGTTPWLAKPADIITDDRDLPAELSAHSGDFFAWLGGLPSATRSIAQKVTVPASVTMLRLEGKIFVATESPSGVAKDTLQVQLLDGADAVLVTPKSFSNIDETLAGSERIVWTDFRVVFAKPERFASLRLLSMNDDANNTNFFFDTLSLEPANCP